MTIRDAIRRWYAPFTSIPPILNGKADPPKPKKRARTIMQGHVKVKVKDISPDNAKEFAVALQNSSLFGRGSQEVY